MCRDPFALWESGMFVLVETGLPSSQQNSFFSKISWGWRAHRLTELSQAGQVWVLVVRKLLGGIEIHLLPPHGSSPLILVLAFDSGQYMSTSFAMTL